MNWLGEICQDEISEADTVLDLGCGIMQATTDSMTKTIKRKFKRTKPDILICKSLLGCEIVDKYLDKAKQYFPVIKFDLTKTEQFDIFPDNSFDVVMALDVIEHLEYQTALVAIGNMERIARKKIIIYTPKVFDSNEKNIENAWNMGENNYHKHRCFIPPARFESWGYVVTFPKPDENTLAIKKLR